MTAHADAEFEGVNGFCRGSCQECDRLDRESLEAGLTQVEVLDKAFDLAVKAAMSQLDMGREEAEALTRESMATVIARMVQP